MLPIRIFREELDGSSDKDGCFGSKSLSQLVFWKLDAAESFLLTPAVSENFFDGPMVGDIYNRGGFITKNPLHAVDYK